MDISSYILYVEDDEIEVMKFTHSIGKYWDSSRVKIANDGLQALDFMECHRLNLPKLIVVDINMPNMNGLELLEKLKSDNEYKSIPVIMLTTSDNRRDIEFSFKNQVAGYFVKPFKAEKYKEIIKSISHYWLHSESI